MRHLYVVTHPEATHHVDRLVGGWFDSSLTPAGQIAAKAIGASLKASVPRGSKVELYSSDLKRTAETATEISKHVNVEVVTDRRLREKSYGIAEGQPRHWLDQRFVPPPVDGERMRHDEGIPGAETKWDLARRVYSAMEDIVGRDCRHQIVVTHGMAATFAIASWLKLPIETMGYAAFQVVSGSITELTEDDYFHNRYLVRFSDIAHLAG